MTVPRVSVFLTTNQLREKLSAALRPSKIGKEVRLLDSSYDYDKETDGYKHFYQKGHIQSALYFDPLEGVERTPHIPFNLPDTNRFTDYVQSLGVSSNTHIITYDRLDKRAALRTWWLFRLHGHRNISILDGGLRKWVRDGFPITTEEPKVERGDFECRIDPSLMQDFNSMKEKLKSGKEEIIDARGKNAFHNTVQTESGEEMKTHISGSKSLPYSTMFNEDGTFKSSEVLMELFKEANIDFNKPWVTMCARGIVGCALNAAAEVMGKHDTPLYYGSWYEWSRKITKDDHK